MRQTESSVVLGEQSGVWQFYRRFSVFMLDFSARTCVLAFSQLRENGAVELYLLIA